MAEQSEKISVAPYIGDLPVFQPVDEHLLAVNLFSSRGGSLRKVPCVSTSPRFGLGLSATAFHWLNEDSALNKVAKLLRPGGWWAMLWNVFDDSSLPDPFHEATKNPLGSPLSPSAGNGEVPFALDTGARRAALERTHAFHNIEHRIGTWRLLLNPDETVALYSTYSNVIIRPDRREVLNELRRIASDDFQGLVTRNMITSLYVAQRRS